MWPSCWSARSSVILSGTPARVLRETVTVAVRVGDGIARVEVTAWLASADLEAGLRPDKIGEMVQFRLLGPLEAQDGERRVELGRPKQRALLAVLLVHANHVVPLDRLIEELWG